MSADNADDSMKEVPPNPTFQTIAAASSGSGSASDPSTFRARSLLRNHSSKKLPVLAESSPAALTVPPEPVLSEEELEKVMATKPPPRRNTVYGDHISPSSSLGDIQLTTDGKEKTTAPTASVTQASSPASQSVVPSYRRNASNFTIVSFINSSSGGGMGTQILKDMQKHLGEEFVFDLKLCGQPSFPMPDEVLLHFALDPFVRVISCGGDGTMGWILSSIDKVWEKVLPRGVQLEDSEYKAHLPLAMMPLGTGNDLSRSFNWGGNFLNSMRRKHHIVTKVIRATPRPLDRWRLGETSSALATPNKKTCVCCCSLQRFVQRIF